MANNQKIESFETQIKEIKEEHKRCGARTLKNLEKLYKLLNDDTEDISEEAGQEAAAAGNTAR